MNIEDLKLKPVFNRIGNKTKHIKHFIDYIPKEYNTYIEPFVGSGALFLYLKSKKWIINDINKDLMNIWILLKNNLFLLIREIKIFKKKYFKYENHDSKMFFLKNQVDKLNNINYTINKSILWLILNKISYMGALHMHNNKYYIGSINNENNIPSIFKEKYFILLNNINYYLNNTHGKIYNKDYKEILKKVKKDDFIFLDPPYIDFKTKSLRYNFNQNLTNNFLNELYDEVKKLDKKDVKWMMTQENTKEVRDTFKEYKIRKYKVYRTFLKKYVYELFITNY